MKVLWFTNTSSCYVSTNQGYPKGYNGGGWIESAEKLFHNLPNLTLGVSFILNNQPFKTIQNNVTYYPIPSSTTNNRVKRYLEKLPYVFPLNYIKKEKESWQYYLEYFKKIIEDFKPDIIHIWGSESYFGLISLITDIPVILHIQGILNPYLNAYLPPFFSWKTFITNKLTLSSIIHNNINKNKWISSCYRERVIFSNIKYFLGRTEWDKRVTHILNLQSHYFHVDEILREKFYNENFSRNIPSKLTIITTISSPLYKGFDLILKTATILKNNIKLDFEWKCFGNINPESIEKIVGIKHKDVNIKIMGVATSEQLIEAELSATLYFHSSYIDNSPNSLCEAQILGLPVISTNVGGISSLIVNKKTGFLIPSNDPYQGAYLIELLYKDKSLNMQMGDMAKKDAIKRHDRKKIIQSITEIYNKILDTTPILCIFYILILL